jgi:hypothetical protein
MKKASSILPVTIHKGKLLFLFGKECDLESYQKGFSDFGGGCENNSNLLQTAIREGAEELTGFLGNETELAKYIHDNGGCYNITLNDYHVHIICYVYDDMLPTYFNNNHKYLWDNLNTKYLNKTKLFEKIEIDWFSIDDMIRRKSEFRPFYTVIVDEIIRDQMNIKKFIKKNISHTLQNKHNKTVKALKKLKL